MMNKTACAYISVLLIFHSFLIFAQNVPSSTNFKPKLVPPLGHTWGVNTAEFSPDEKYILTSGDKTAKVWDTETGLLVHNLTGHTRDVESAAYAFAGKYIVTKDSTNYIRIWDATSGDFLFDIQGYDRFTKKLQYSPDKKQLVVLSDDSSVDVWDLEKQKLLFTLSGLFPKIWSISYSDNGKEILTTSTSGILKTWNSATGNQILNLNAHNDLSRAKFSPDGKIIASTSLDGSLKVWKAKNGQNAWVKTDFTSGVNKADFTGNGDELLVLELNGSVSVRKTSDGTIRYPLNTPIRLWPEYNANSQQIAIAHADSVSLWNAKTGKNLQLIKGETGESATDVPNIQQSLINIITFSPDGKKLAAKISYLIFENGVLVPKVAVNIWETQTGKLLCILKEKKFNIKYMLFNPSSKDIITVSTDYYVQLWNANTGELKHTLTGHIFPIKTIRFNQDSTKLKVLADGQKHFQVWDLNTWKADDEAGEEWVEPPPKVVLKSSWQDTIHDIDAEGNPIFFISTIAASIPPFSMDSNMALSKSDRLLLQKWQNDLVFQDYSEHYKDTILSGHTDEISEAHFFEQKAKIISGSYDGSLRFWDKYSHEKLLTIFPVDSVDWVVIHPSGLFDASPKAMSLMYFTVKNEILELDQLKERYYEPGLYQKVMKGEKLRDVAQFVSLDMYPSIQAQIDKNILKVILTKRNGGIGKVSLSVNGKEVRENINPDQQSSFTIDLNQFQKYYVSDTLNKISLRSYNKQNWLKSAEYSLYYTPLMTRGDGESIPILFNSKKHNPSFYAVIVGTSDYSGKKLDLKFPDKDADYIRQAVSQSAKVLFGEEKVHIKSFATDLKDGAETPSKSNIKKAFDSFSNAKPEDILFVYFSGHGVSFGGVEDQQFYYLTKDCLSGEISDPAIREKYTISTKDLTQWISNIPAQKQVMIIDACASGRIVDDLSSQKDVPTSQVRALDRMKDRMGMYVLTGSAADKVSFEASQFGQGLLTYSLLQGMSGDALQNEIDVDISTLFQFTRDKVPEYAKDIGGIQIPVIFAPLDASSFPIGQVTDDVDIKLEAIKPVFIRCNIVDKNFGDHLDLTSQTNDYLDALSYREFSEIIFVNVPKKKNAYQITGGYELGDAGAIRFAGRLYKNKEIILSFDLQGKKSDLTQLVEDIVDKVSASISLN